MPQILVVDDDPIVRNLLSWVLEDMSCEVLSASDGVAGLKAAQSSQPDLVILDIEMPGLNGYEVCSRLRNDPATSATPILMLTAKSLDLDKEKGIGAGADAYMSKPFDISELGTRLEILLKISH